LTNELSDYQHGWTLSIECLSSLWPSRLQLNVSLEFASSARPDAAAAAAHPDPASFDELDAKSLERLLRSLEG